MRLRLISSFVLVILVTVTGVLLIARQGAVREVNAFMVHGGMVEDQELVTALQDYYRDNGSWVGVNSVLGRSGGMGMHGMMTRSQRLRLADADGKLIFDSANTRVTGFLSQADMNRALPLSVDQRTVGYLLAEGGMLLSQDDEAALLDRITQAVVIAGLIASAIGLLLALLLIRRILIPVNELSYAADRLAHGDLNVRVDPIRDSELARLGAAFNQMADSLQKVENDRRALTADIAHELRTPLAVQRAQLEALLDGIYPLDASNLGVVLSQNLTLTRLVDDLRTLALADAGRLQLEYSLVNLGELVQQTVEGFQPHAAERFIDLQFEMESNQEEKSNSVKVDATRIQQVMSNLLANAIRYTPESGWVRIKLNTSGRQAQITVEDNGPGIPEDALPHIFDRFFRADASRNREAGGAGLGLSIARRLAEAHGGSLTARNRSQGGAEFTLKLPIDHG